MPMLEYPKMMNIFKRDYEGNKKLIIGKWSEPEFEALADIDWEWTEKIDGTNIRVYWNREEGKVRYAGRTDRASIPTHLMARLQDLFDENECLRGFDEVTLFGEGYGQRIQNPAGDKYKPDGADFVLFDVFCRGQWLRREAVDGVADGLGVRSVPLVGTGSLMQAVDWVREGNQTGLAVDGPVAEGVVVRPVVRLFDGMGKRIIAKIKARDFA